MKHESKKARNMSFFSKVKNLGIFNVDDHKSIVLLRAENAKVSIAKMSVAKLSVAKMSVAKMSAAKRALCSHCKLIVTLQ